MSIPLQEQGITTITTTIINLLFGFLELLASQFRRFCPESGMTRDEYRKCSQKTVNSFSNNVQETRKIPSLQTTKRGHITSLPKPRNNNSNGVTLQSYGDRLWGQLRPSGLTCSRRFYYHNRNPTVTSNNEGLSAMWT